MSADLLQSESPFHLGEREIQERLGVRDGVALFAGRAVRDFLPDQHRAFYDRLPFLVIGAVDTEGRPWAALVSGKPGFISSPDARRLDVAAAPLFGDPVLHDLPDGADIGILGIELETRRRNRATGRFRARDGEGFSVLIDQTFGNCPQYIQTRTVAARPDLDETDHLAVVRSDRFDRRSTDLIEKSDTMFIATAFREDAGAPTQGADVSHRGGKPGFVKVEDERTFVFPDFRGNNYFNTLGNIVMNPKAGFLFADFDTGDLVYVTGEAEIVWDGEDVRAFDGAERLVRVRVAEVRRVNNSLPLRFNFGAFSPVLGRTGSWMQLQSSI